MKTGLKDTLCEKEIAFLLGKKHPVRVVESIESTNTELWRQGKAGAANGSVLIAKSQTDGKGRLGRCFCSKQGGLYMSLLLRPELAPEDTALITPLAALAVAEAVDKHLGGTSQIKWVNDVYRDGKKACGILTEASIDPVRLKTEFVVIGVGLNVYAPANGFPEEIKDIATALLPANEMQDGLMNSLAADIVKGICGFAENPTDRATLEAYKGRCFVLGEELNVYRGNESFTAKAVGLDERYGLIVEIEDGTKRTLSSGEVSVRLKGGAL